jgi:hypothetical protein
MSKMNLNMYFVLIGRHIFISIFSLEKVEIVFSLHIIIGLISTKSHQDTCFAAPILSSLIKKSECECQCVIDHQNNAENV